MYTYVWTVSVAAVCKYLGVGSQEQGCCLSVTNHSFFAYFVRKELWPSSKQQFGARFGNSLFSFKFTCIKRKPNTSDCNLEKILPVAACFLPALVLHLLSLPANHEKEPAFKQRFLAMLLSFLFP